MVVEILTVTAKDEAEKTSLGKTLDEKIDIIEGKKQAPQSALNFLGELFGI